MPHSAKFIIVHGALSTYMGWNSKSRCCKVVVVCLLVLKSVLAAASMPMVVTPGPETKFANAVW